MMHTMVEHRTDSWLIKMLHYHMQYKPQHMLVWGISSTHCKEIVGELKSGSDPFLIAEI